MSKHSTNGFTLIELMVTISIMVILVTMAVPSLQALIERNAVAGQVDSLVSSLITARSEAIKRNTIVVMCRSNNPEMLQRLRQVQDSHTPRRPRRLPHQDNVP